MIKFQKTNSNQSFYCSCIRLKKIQCVHSFLYDHRIHINYIEYRWQITISYQFDNEYYYVLTKNCYEEKEKYSQEIICFGKLLKNL